MVYTEFMILITIRREKNVINERYTVTQLNQNVLFLYKMI